MKSYSNKECYIVSEQITKQKSVSQSKVNKVKKGKVPVLSTEHHAMKAYWESGGIAPRII
jgi:predicted transcriptional regulator